MTKYELVRETKIDGTIQYFIEKDGKYIARSVTDDLEQAEEFLNIIAKGGNLETLKETIKTIEVND